jgi:hypothetical protein
VPDPAISPGSHIQSAPDPFARVDTIGPDELGR